MSIHATDPARVQRQAPQKNGSAADLENESLLLSVDQASRLNTFRHNVESCQTSDEKLHLCAQTRRRLLDPHVETELVIALYGRVMQAECLEYRNLEETSREAASEGATGEAAEWNRFLERAKRGEGVIRKCLPYLRSVDRCWGLDKVQHYRWPSRGWKFCKMLGRLARKMGWAEFVIKCNQLLRRRHMMYQRRSLRDSPDPVDQVELENLMGWQGPGWFVKDKDAEQVRLEFEVLGSEQLPVEFGLDQYGLMVPREHAVVLSAEDAVEDAVEEASDPMPSPEPEMMLVDSILDETPDGSPSSSATALADGPDDNSIGDEAYRQRVLTELESTPHQPGSFGRRTDVLMLDILRRSTPPTCGSFDGEPEAYFCATTEEAAAVVERGCVGAPVFTHAQQHFQWSPDERAIAQIFSRMGDLNREVCVQVPSLGLDGHSWQTHTLVEVRDRFLNEEPTTTTPPEDPWNLLDLRSPLPASTVPAFLHGENCQLLLHIRDAALMGRAHRPLASRQVWTEWRDVIDWLLLSQGGHNTAPHTDSHGLSTWITVQEGLFGFGWMARPTDAERSAWMANPHSYTDGRWRHVVLRAGQTVFFESGTIHFVFRIRGGQTLAVGGHILQWSSVAHWLAVVVAQLQHPNTTNEDMEKSAHKFILAVANLIIEKIHRGRLADVGGRDEVERFFALVGKLAEEQKISRPTRKNRIFISEWREWMKVVASL